MWPEDNGDTAASNAVDPVTRHLLEVSVRLMQNVQVMTQHLMVQRGIPTATIPIPNTPARPRG